MKPGGTRWDETGCSMDIWNPFQTRVKLVLLCSVEVLKSQCTKKKKKEATSLAVSGYEQTWQQLLE